MANPSGLHACQQTRLSQVRLLTEVEAARSAELGSGGVTPLPGTSSWDGVVGCMGAAEVARRWLSNLGARGALKPHAGHLGRVFKVTRSLDRVPNLGSCHLDNTATGDLGKHTPL